jgi:outer membrane receptor protein involved in Fe transport
VRSDTPTFGARASTSAPLRERPRAAASDFDLQVGDLGRVPRANAQQLLTLQPGLLLVNHAGEGHAATMFIRGFDAAEGEDMEVLVEGVPMNEVSNAHGHGYADTLPVVPGLVSRLRTVQGPFDPIQGDFATAGTSEYLLGLPERGLHVRVGYGMYGRRTATALWGPEGEPEGTFVGLTWNAGDGFGPRRDFENGAAMAQIEAAIPQLRARARALLFAGVGAWSSAGVIRADDFLLRRLPCARDERAQFFCVYDPQQGGTTSKVGASGTIERTTARDHLRLQFFGILRDLRIRENFTGFTSDPRTDGGPQRGDLLDQRYGAATFGGRAAWRTAFDWLGQRHRTELGLYVRRDDVRTTQDRLRRELGVPYTSDFDREIGVTNVAAYARGDLRPTRWLTLTGGARADLFGVDVLDLDRPAADRIGERLPREGTTAYGTAVSPRGSVSFRLAPWLDWTWAAGLGARSSDAAALSQDELVPFVRVAAFESGLLLDTGERGDLRVEARTTAFVTRVERDLVFDPAAGRNTTTQPSHRAGALAYARLRAGRWLDLAASATWTHARLVPFDSTIFDVGAGVRLPYVPEVLVRFDGALVRPFRIAGVPLTGSLAVGALLLGPRPLPLGQAAEPYFVLDAAASVRWRFVEVGVSAENVLDARYRAVELNYASNFGPFVDPAIDPGAPGPMAPVRHFSAGPPLQVLATLALHFGPEPAPPDPDDDHEHELDHDHPAHHEEHADAPATEPSP